MYWSDLKPFLTILFPVLFAASASGQVPDPKARITVQPTDQAAPIGGLARFSVTASGQAPITYLWLRNGVPVPASDGPEWVVSVASTADQGAKYRCVVANDFGVDSSVSATLNISATLQPPGIRTQPDSSPVAIGDTAILKVSASGTAPLSFTWFKNDVAIPSSNDSVLKVFPVSWSINGSAYRCHVANAAGTADSRVVMLQVVQPNGKTVVIVGNLHDNQAASTDASDPFEMDMIVRLYKEANGGVAVYEERFLSGEGHGVKVAAGRFSLVLGRSVSTGDLSQVAQANPALYVSFSVAKPGLTPEVLEPRTPFTSAPYSLSAPKSAAPGGP